jgi:hypothetical protein
MSRACPCKRDLRNRAIFLTGKQKLDFRISLSVHPSHLLTVCDDQGVEARRTEIARRKADALARAEAAKAHVEAIVLGTNR